MERQCLQCGKGFKKAPYISRRNWEIKTKYCSAKCGNESRRGKLSWNAGLKYKDELKEKCISKKCRQASSERMKGNKYSLGRKLTDEQKKRQKKGMMGHKVSEECRKKLSLRVGEKASNWKGGISNEAEHVRKITKYKEWRKAVFERDNYTCQICGKGGMLHADHIKPFKIILREYREKYGKVDILKIQEFQPLWDISNGRTLCIPCHHKTETYGYRN